MPWKSKKCVILGVFCFATVGLLTNLSRNRSSISNEEARKNKYSNFRTQNRLNKIKAEDEIIRCSVHRLSCVTPMFEDWNSHYYSMVKLDSMTQSKCIEECSTMEEVAFAGLYEGNTCVCLKSALKQLIDFEHIDGSCNLPCPGDFTQTCGGYHAVEIFKIIKPCAPYTEASIASSMANESFRGCIGRDSLTEHVTSEGIYSPTGCFITCEKKEFVIAAHSTEDGQCFCTNPWMGLLDDSTTDQNECESMGHSVKVYKTFAIDERCATKNFLPRNSPSAKVALFSFPGSGNSWFRHLIESVSGVFTGSKYKEGAYMNAGMLGEGVEFLSNRVVVSKTHDVAVNCSQYITIIRNPYDAILADYKRRHATHTSDVANIDEEDLNKFASKMIYPWYKRMCNVVESNKPYKIVFFEDAIKNATMVAEQMLTFLPSWSYNSTETKERLDCLYLQTSGSFKRKRVKRKTKKHYFYNETIQRINSFISEMEICLQNTTYRLPNYKKVPT